jgi:hypothetical protein
MRTKSIISCSFVTGFIFLIMSWSIKSYDPMEWSKDNVFAFFLITIMIFVFTAVSQWPKKL